jgi:NTP pyrophosphatase (non-canonical NTP hydrolase)
MDSRIKTIADHYSYEAQSRQCMEECAELIQAINKLWRAKEIEEAKEAGDNLVKEIADVQIMLWQMQYFAEIEGYETQEEINSKLDRQMQRIKEESHV